MATTAPQSTTTVTVGGTSYPIYNLGQDFQPLKTVNPIYPAVARQEGRGGMTKVGAVVNEKGRVRGVFVESSNADPDLQKAALAAVSKWRSSIVTVDGQKISYAVFVPIVRQTE